MTVYRPLYRKHTKMENIQQPIIRLNTYGHDFMEGEAFVTDHIFSYIISGTQEIWSGNQTYLFKAGDYRFFRRNQLTKYVKRSDQQAYRSMAVHIDQATLLDMAGLYSRQFNTPQQERDIVLLQPNVYLENYINSLTPYLNTTGIYKEPLLALKTRELVFLLLQTDPALSNSLFNFNVPGKIDLVSFMYTHYRYNVGLDRMAYLTGRSLSTFKREFKKTFHTTPGQWLTTKRLEEAHYLIGQKGKTASEIYLDLGFEDLSHFSFAYKKVFGKSPAQR